MSKQEFLDALRKKLKDLPPQDVEESLNFYREMIDDRMDEGLSEEEAVASVGAAEEIAAQILAEARPQKSKSAKGDGTAKHPDQPQPKAASRRTVKAWEIVLLALGSPIWLALLIAAFAVVLALFAVLWSLVAAAWSVFTALCGGALGGVAGGIVLLCAGNGLACLALAGAGMTCGGLAIFLFFGCLAATVGAAKLTKTAAVGIARGISRGCVGFFKRETEV